MLDILLVEDDAEIRELVGPLLLDRGHRVTEATDGVAALAEVAGRAADFDLVVSDIRMPRLDGLALFRDLRRRAPGTDMILITGVGVIEDAVAALKEGAADYLVKPLDGDELLCRIQRIAERRALSQALLQAQAALQERAGADACVARSPAMVALLQRVDTFAQTAAPVLISGESGTGKELIARRLHRLGPRAGGPFIAVSCAALPEALLEAELFGHERGAFTGAMRRREGRFQAADRGTLLLDEVGEMSLAAQAKLLRVLQEGMIEPLGSSAPVRVDVRVVSATHRNLKRLVAEGRFREDLYYRLNVLDVALPPLRQRREDLPVLVAHFLRQQTAPGRAAPGVSPQAWAALSRYPFPGNVRELRHAIERAVVLSGGGEVRPEHLPEDIAGGSSAEGAGRPLPLAAAVRAFEREYLLQTLRHTEGGRGRLAEVLGISRKNLWEKLRLHGLLDVAASG